MDRKDLELIIRLFEFGRVDPSAIAPLLSITEVNVHRRIVLLEKEGIISGFSAFFDRRSMGFDTTFLKVHFPNRMRTQVLDDLGRTRWAVSLYPNIDDFALVEVVHKDTAALRTIISRVEETCTISAAFVPMLPEMVPDLEPEDVLLLRLLVKNGYATCQDMARSLGSDACQVSRRLEMLQGSGAMRILPLLREEEVYPYPCFSFIISFDNTDGIPSAMGLLGRIAPLRFHVQPFAKPPGLWLRSFGHDLQAMDHMLERLRRLDTVSELIVILPDGTRYRREVDLRLLDR